MPRLSTDPETPQSADAIPEYLNSTYTWAYLNQRTLPWLDRSLVVSVILWGNAGRLMKAAIAEFPTGQRVLQAACVYGGFSPMLARQVGPEGALDVVDVAPIQIANVRRKFATLPHANAYQANLTQPLHKTYEGVCCFFLLHEVPENQRSQIVDNLLAAVEPGGKALFVDYHRPHRWHPLRPVMNLIFRWLEPYAPSLLDVPIESLSARSADFTWKRHSVFGGLYQHVVAVRKAVP